MRICQMFVEKYRMSAGKIANVCVRQRWKTKYPHAQQNAKHCCLHTSRQRTRTTGYRLKNSTKHNKRCVRRFHVGEGTYTVLKGDESVIADGFPCL